MAALKCLSVFSKSETGGVFMNRRISQQGFRDLYGLVSECLSLGADGVAWRRHLVYQLVSMLDVESAYFADFEVVGPHRSVKGWIRPTLVVDRWPAEENRRHFWEVFLRRGRLENTPIAHIVTDCKGVRVASLRELQHDKQCSRSDFYRHYIAPLDLGDLVFSASHDPHGSVQILAIQRSAGRPDLPRWVVHWLRALWVELRKMQPETLAGFEHSLFTQVPRRRLQVLACLLSGCTVNETAGLLKISPNTAQEHVKRLYHQLGARNRAELAARCTAALPVLTAMPLEEFPDYSRDTRHATREPWPVEPSIMPLK